MEKELTGKAEPLILIVDDVETNRFILRDIIAEMGYKPVLTENGVQALKMVERRKPQLIILDVAMPQMDGYEFCQIVKKNANMRDIPIIFISAFDEPEDIVKGFKLGGEDYITKPFIPEVVKARIEIHLKLSEASKNLEALNRKLQTSINEQLRQAEREKKNVLYALHWAAQENSRCSKSYLERLSRNTKILAEAMQLSAKYGDKVSDRLIEVLELAAPLYYLENVTIILSDMKETGDYNEFIQIALDMLEAYREHWDGSGTPAGKCGEEIPLAAQIIAVADAYCFLTEEDADKNACEVNEAFAIMEKDSGVKYNPEIFQILKKIHRQLR